MKILGAIALICFLGVMTAPHLAAQGTTATILGTVTDSTGAAIPGAAIQVKNVGTGLTQSTQSDPQGRYRVPDLAVGDYEVQSSKQGFATVLRKGDTWYVVDLRSVNGTFVDGYRVAGERELPTGATLRVGAVEMIFRSFIAGVEAPPPVRPSTGILGWLKRLFRKPPSESHSHPHSHS